MAKFRRGDVVVLPFPFSDGTGVKRRPDLVLSELPFFGGMDYLVCLITSRDTGDPRATELMPRDLRGGTFAVKSYLRPLYLFAAEEGAIIRRIGTLAPAKLQQAAQAVADTVNP